MLTRVIVSVSHARSYSSTPIYVCTRKRRPSGAGKSATLIISHPLRSTLVAAPLLLVHSASTESRRAATQTTRKNQRRVRFLSNRDRLDIQAAVTTITVFHIERCHMRLNKNTNYNENGRDRKRNAEDAIILKFRVLWAFL